jgi:hypothetical protein
MVCPSNACPPLWVLWMVSPPPSRLCMCALVCVSLISSCTVALCPPTVSLPLHLALTHLSPTGIQLRMVRLHCTPIGPPIKLLLHLYLYLYLYLHLHLHLYLCVQAVDERMTAAHNQELAQLEARAQQVLNPPHPTAVLCAHVCVWVRVCVYVLHLWATAVRVLSTPSFHHADSDWRC